MGLHCNATLCLSENATLSKRELSPCALEGLPVFFVVEV